MLPKLNDRERKHLGLRGEDSDFLRRGDTFEVVPAGACFADTGAQVDEIKPGDVVIIFSNVTVTPQSTVAAVEVHGDLLERGFCSFPQFLSDDFAGRLQCLFRCERDVTVANLPYLFKVFSLGQLKS